MGASMVLVVAEVHLMLEELVDLELVELEDLLEVQLLEVLEQMHKVLEMEVLEQLIQVLVVVVDSKVLQGTMVQRVCLYFSFRRQARQYPPTLGILGCR
jgi:hypothetical protein